MGNKNSAFDTKLKAKEWQWELGREAKRLDKEIQKIQKDEAKMQNQIREHAAKGAVDSVQMLARSVVKTRKAVQRLEKTKAAMEAVKLQLTTSIASMSTAHSITLSTDIMRKMNAIARIPEVSGTMDEMRRQMAMCADAEDSIEDALREDGEEREAAVEVQKVLEEMALDQLGPLAKATPAPVVQEQVAPAQAPAAAERQPVAVGEGYAAPVSKLPTAPAPQAQPPPAPSASSAAQPPLPPPAGAPGPSVGLGSSAAPPTVAVQPPSALPPTGSDYAPPAAAVQPPSALPPAGSDAAPPAAAVQQPSVPPTAGAPSSAEDDLMRRLEALKKP